ncbi:hypothetical protein SAMN05216207_104632 [Pseudonocardia ammonioxydans]|uniref:Uncharacterized protein n=1 Tax=Pseudonocardia ammonioxydans TaxID=260086 RepID=A0A1I5GG21_PSUAM|nr:hypothetical protein [Pseudonocardia ammonioxydans]SFO34847.1 hypothetical protein SAMN05216207_104632 [Pseudonocardia ammonioxydans]
MNAALPLPPYGSPVGRRVAATMARLGDVASVTTARDLLADAVHTGHRWEVADGDRIVGTRHGASTSRDLTGEMVAAFCRDRALGHVPDDPFGGRLTDVQAVADEVADEVAALVRRDVVRAARTTTLSLAESVARRVLASRIAWLDQAGRCWWRPAGPADPVRGGTGVTVPPPIGGDRGRSLLDIFRRLPADAVEVTEGVVRAAGMPTLSSHERPHWPDVLAEVRQLAGAGAATHP